MLLKRSFFYYVLFAIALFMVDMDLLHKQRGGFLWYLHQEAGKGKNLSAAVHYYDYLRRLDPTDITIWEDLVNSYVSANDFVKARETALHALQMTSKNSKNYPKLLGLYQTLNEELLPK